MYRIGIDLGGTNIAVGVVNDRYEIVARRSVPTGAERPAEEVIRDMGDAVEEALRQAGRLRADASQGDDNLGAVRVGDVVSVLALRRGAVVRRDGGARRVY